jgi:predicted nucleic-acid-binding Zn-ribbon protein
MNATETKEHECPKCHKDSFGRYNQVPVTIGGWHGGVRVAWGRYAGVHMTRFTAKRCEDCGYTESVDPNWD